MAGRSYADSPVGRNSGGTGRIERITPNRSRTTSNTYEEPQHLLREILSMTEAQQNQLKKMQDNQKETTKFLQNLALKVETIEGAVTDLTSMSMNVGTSTSGAKTSKKIPKDSLVCYITE